jgi:CheY-like chemotaxis protein
MSLILVVDDAADTARMTSMLLQMLGYETVEAVTGRQAIDLCMNTCFDGVLLDIRLPDINGLEVARLLRRLYGERPRIIATTALSGRTNRVQCLDAGCDYYLRKPFTLQDISSLLPSLTDKDTNVPVHVQLGLADASVR